MAKIIWLASYPKSGNTWMRILLANFLSTSPGPVDINKLAGAPIASARVCFDEWVGIESSALDDKTIERLRPDVYRCMARAEHETLYMKVHDSWGTTDKGEALFPADVTAGVVYIIRNPLDMAASCAHHWGMNIDQATESLCDPAYALQRSLGGMADQLYQKLGSWSSHVQSWLDESGLPVHLVRYEDLQRDPVNTFADVIRFCGMTAAYEQINKAVAYSDFRELQRQERENGFRERSVQAPGGFFRKGTTGGWREEISASQAQKIINAHSKTMLRYGYLDDNNLPV